MFGCVLSGVNALCSIAMLVCVWFVLRDLVAAAPDFARATQAPAWGLAAMGFGIGGLAVYFGALMLTHIAAFRTAKNMRMALLEHLSRVPLGFFSARSTGELRRVIENATGLTEGVLAHRLPDFVGALLTPVAYLAVMFVFDWLLGLLCLVPIVVSALCMAWMMAGGAKDENANAMTFMRNYQDALDRMNKAAVEYVRGIPVVKVFQQTVRSFSTFRESMVAYRDFATAYVKLCSPPQVAQLVAINCTFAVLVPGGHPACARRRRLFGVLHGFLVLCGVLGAYHHDDDQGDVCEPGHDRGAGRRFAHRGHLGHAADGRGGCRPAREPKGNSIDFYHVRFRYPGAAQDVLSDVTFSVEHGTTVALVGPSGGGKTTVASLVPRFWDVAEGAVRIGDVDVRDIPSARLMERVAFVFQNERLFKQSLADNIRAARPDATRAQVEAAAHAAQCDDIVAKLPDGLDTVVGAKGIYLSGGECQRVALARAILKDAPIVVLDEATAYADPENEVLIQRALAELTRGKTVLMIAHRLSTVVNADAILVLEGGRLVERGTHADLVAAGGLYARMWDDYQTSATWRIEGGKGAGDAA